MKAYVLLIALLAAATGLCAASEKDSAKTDSAVAVSQKDSVEEGGEKAEEKLTILFFINPRGRPCQMQDRVIKDAGEKITDHAEIQYVKTTVKKDRPLFSLHFVRGLPMLVILREGKEVHRFTPGIQSEQAIAAALKKVLESE
jgi:thioredoxin-like negative regulator of GroEL